MRWEEQGEGVAVVLVHGIPTSPALWRHVVPAVHDARCLAWEMVGYGQSIPQGRERDISVRRQADYLLAWMAHLGIGPTVIVGHDLGGGVAQIAAVRAPTSCAALVLTNAVCYDSWPIPSVKAMRTMAPLVERTPKALFKRVLTAFLAQGHDNADRAAESADLHWHNYDRHDGAAAFIRQVRSLDVHDTLAVAADLATLEVPARVVWGTADRFQKVGYGERLATDLRTRLRRIEGGKHFVPEDHPAEMALAVNEVLAEVGG